MNERIKELSKQAWDYVLESDNRYTKTSTQLFDEKFAELIVRECAMFVVVELEGQVGSRIADATANRLEEHFGVT